MIDEQASPFSMDKGPNQPDFHKGADEAISLSPSHQQQTTPETEQRLCSAVALCQQAVAVSDSAARLLCFNPHFEQWAMDGMCVRFTNYELNFINSEQQRYFINIVEQASRGHVGDLCLKPSAGVLRAMPLPDSLCSHAVLLVVLLPKTHDISWCKVLYGFTEKEYQLVQALATGASLKEIADLQYVSYNTTRQHLRSVLAKSGVHSQTELIAHLLQYSSFL